MDENKDKACHHSHPGIYQPRHPENTVLYQVFQEYLETWITQTQEEGSYVPSHVEKDFREYLKCGLLCYGFARARCTCCNEFLVAFSCRGMAFAHHAMLVAWWKRLPIWLTMFSHQE